MSIEKSWQEEYSWRAVFRKKHYEKAGQTKYSFYRKLNIFKKFLSDTKRHGNSVYRILDLGCGPGSYIYEIIGQNKTFKFYGIDYSIKMLEYARKEYGIDELVCADARNIPFKTNSMDLIFSMGLFQYTVSAPGIAESLYSILKPSGVCFINTLSSAFRIRAHTRGVTSYYPKEIKNIFYNAGFRRVRVAPVLLVPGFLRMFHFLEEIKIIHAIIWPVSHDLNLIAEK
ncbi:MAG: class I SAM-dependent methyltransferase [bacterium]